MISFRAYCPICSKIVRFNSDDDYYSCRDFLISPECPYNGCVTRERALAIVLFSIIPRKFVLENKIICEFAPAPRGLSLYLKENAKNYIQSGYFPGHPFGEYVNGLRNEDMENLTFEDNSIDIIIHMDVLEHLFDPFKALRETYRVLRKDGICIFTAPTYPGLVNSKQVAFRMPDGSVKVDGEPEYHGNPQDPQGMSLLTWKYGYDLPLLISRETGFDVEVRRFQDLSKAVCGIMNDVYILRKRNAGG